MYNDIPQPEAVELTGPAAWLAWDFATEQLDHKPIEPFSLEPMKGKSHE